ncbi:MAG: NUDIX hydrolase [Planctomycetes bacterium]|nr:NUDIX hydrolase [Planctomycetota bacterium]
MEYIDPKYCFTELRITVDTVLIRRGREASEVLLIQRVYTPYKDRWCLPGGFLDPGETPEQGARRELEEETGLVVDGLYHYLGYFDTPGRDPRGPTASYVYYAFYEGTKSPKGGDDARHAAWHDVRSLPALGFDHGDILGAAELAMRGPARAYASLLL